MHGWRGAAATAEKIACWQLQQIFLTSVKHSISLVSIEITDTLSSCLPSAAIDVLHTLIHLEQLCMQNCDLSSAVTATVVEFASIAARPAKLGAFWLDWGGLQPAATAGHACSSADTPDAGHASSCWGICNWISNASFAFEILHATCEGLCAPMLDNTHGPEQPAPTILSD